MFLAGLAVFVFPTYWQWHSTFVHVFEGMPILLLIVAWAGRLSRGARLWPFAIVALILLQYATANLREQMPLLSALHPLTGFLFLLAAFELAKGSTRGLRS